MLFDRLELRSFHILWQARRRPYVAVGWFWYLGTLVPVLGLVQAGSQGMADRCTYIPLIGAAAPGIVTVVDMPLPRFWAPTSRG